MVSAETHQSLQLGKSRFESVIDHDRIEFILSLQLLLSSGESAQNRIL